MGGLVRTEYSVDVHQRTDNIFAKGRTGLSMKSEGEEAPLVGVGGAVESIPEAGELAVETLDVAKPSEVFGCFLGI